MGNLAITLSAKKGHLVFRAIKFVDGIQDGESRVGILAIEDTTKADATLAKAKKLEWSMGDEADDNGFYTITRD